MRHLILIITIALVMLSCSSNEIVKQEPINNDSLTISTLKEWRDSHFGMFIHFGVYSELGGIWKGEKIPYYGEQIMNHARITIPEYEEVAKKFNPEQFDADAIIQLAKRNGMKYIVFTTKHHDGFCMFHTETTEYNIVDFTPYGKDIVKELADACHRHNIGLGFYYSLPDWHYPKGIERLAPDENSDCTEYVNQVYSPLEIITPELEDYIALQLTELLSNYGDIVTIWFDMGLLKPEQSIRFRNIVKSLQPKCLVSGRIMNNCGDYMTLPDNGDVAYYANIFWDNPASLYNTWGYKSWIQRPEVSLQTKRQIDRLLNTVSNGGVFLLNIGPDGKGNVIDYEKDVLNGIGDFLLANPDTLSRVKHNEKTKPSIKPDNDIIVLTDDNGTKHAAIDATGYISTQTDSWRSWTIETDETGEYDVFVIYLPDNEDKKYIFHNNNDTIIHTLPGVDKMKQTSYAGRIAINKGISEFILDQYERCHPLEPLGLNLYSIILRKAKQ